MKTSLFTTIAPKKTLINKINQRHQLSAKNVVIDKGLSESTKAILEANKSSIGRYAGKKWVNVEFKPANDLFGNTQMVINESRITFPGGMYNPNLPGCGHVITKKPIAMHVLDSNQDTFVNDIKKGIKMSVSKEKTQDIKSDLLNSLYNYLKK